VASAQGRTARVVVAPFTGERSAVTRAVVIGALANHSGEIELLSQNEYNAAAARMSLSEHADEASAASVAREIGADQVVVGALDRTPEGLRLRLRVVRSNDARSVGSASWEFNRAEELNAFSNEIWEQLRGSFRVDPTLTIPSRNNSSRNASSQTPVASVREIPLADVPRAIAATATTPDLGWLTLSLGGGFSGRRWRIPVLGETTQRGYENNAFGELRGSIGAYYRLDHNRFGIGVEGGLGIPLGLSSQGRGTDGRAVSIATSAVDLYVGASLLMRPNNGGIFHVFFGMMYQSFSLDTSRLSFETRLAPVNYIGLRIAGEGILPIVANRDWELGVVFGGELRIATVGSEVKEAFGLNPSTTFGLGTWFGLSGRLDRAAPGLGVRATAEFLRYSTDFAGPARIGTPGESVDGYTRFIFAFTYALGTERNPQVSPPAQTTNDTRTGSDGETRTTPARDPFGAR
jgi:hypothetical protein